MKEDGGRSIEVEIMGLKLKVGSRYDAEYTRKIAGYVEREMESAKKSFNTASSLDIAVIAAMNIAYRHVKVTEEQKKELSVLLDKSERLINYIGERIS